MLLAASRDQRDNVGLRGQACLSGEEKTAASVLEEDARDTTVRVSMTRPHDQLSSRGYVGHELQGKLPEAGLQASEEPRGHSGQQGAMVPLSTSSSPASRRPATDHPAEPRRHVQPQSYLNECENGRALRGGSRRRRNTALGEGGQGPPRPSLKLQKATQGPPRPPPVLTPPGRAGHAPCLHSPQAPTL